MEKSRLSSLKVLPLLNTESLRYFSCGDADLDDFFKNEALLFDKQLLGKSYIVVDSETMKTVAAFTLANDSVKTNLLTNKRRNSLTRNIPNAKRLRNYPAVLVARLGISVDIHGGGIGSFVLDYVKNWFVESGNKTGCRYVVVDAYNQEKVIAFYQRNGFGYMYETEEEERAMFNIKGEGALHSRLLFFDLIKIMN